MTVITAEHLTKRYKGEKAGEPTVTAVHDVSFNLKEGDTLALLGPSGCGKTTLLRLVAGLEQPDEGHILYNDQPLFQLPTENRNIGMVFQNYALVPHWEAHRTIGFFLRLRKREREVPQRVADVSKITGVGIEKLMGKLPRQMSDGEKQKVAIARAFARDLDLLLFDEPFANLDAKFRAQARIELRRLMDEYPVTAIIVTHDQQEASSLAQRIALMRDGKIVQLGSYRHLYDSPQTLFAAEFLGAHSINLFAGESRDGHWYGEQFGGYLIHEPVSDGKAVTMGIRAEHMQLVSNETERSVAGTVQSVTPYYAERYNLLEIQRGREHWQVRIDLSESVQVGATVHVTLHANEALYFDTQTGQRLA